MLETAKNTIAIIFLSKFPAIFTNIFQRKIIPVCSRSIIAVAVGEGEGGGLGVRVRVRLGY